MPPVRGRLGQQPGQFLGRARVFREDALRRQHSLAGTSARACASPAASARSNSSRTSWSSPTGSSPAARLRKKRDSPLFARSNPSETISPTRAVAPTRPEPPTRLPRSPPLSAVHQPPAGHQPLSAEHRQSGVNRGENSDAWTARPAPPGRVPGGHAARHRPRRSGRGEQGAERARCGAVSEAGAAGGAGGGPWPCGSGGGVGAAMRRPSAGRCSRGGGRAATIPESSGHPTLLDVIHATGIGDGCPGVVVAGNRRPLLAGMGVFSGYRPRHRYPDGIHSGYGKSRRSPRPVNIPFQARA